jgi:Metallopeptidase family M24
MTVWSSVAVVLGLALGLLGPCLGRRLLAAFAAVLVLLVLAWRASVGAWSFLLGGLVLVLLETAAVWLVVRRPRFGLVPALLFALMVGVVPLMVGTGSRPSVASIVLGVLCLGLAIWGLVRPALGLRLVAASVGARLVLTALPGETAGWQWPVLALVLFFVGRLASPRAELKRAPRHLPRDAALGAALVALGCVAAVALLTKELRPPDARGESRLLRLRALAPRGGYLWPALSETVAWEDNTGYRAWDSLDVRYLNGSGDRGIFRLPGSAPWLGRFSLNREVEKMRGIKDAAELEDLTAAAQAIVSAVRETAPGRSPGVSELAIAQSIQRRGRAGGCTEDSFPPVVASGPRAASIHAAPTEAKTQVGEMVMVDVGCSVHHYASDFTRTFPVGGHFTAEDRRYYEAVYAAQQAALAACRPGAVISGKGPKGEPSLDSIAHGVLQQQLGQRGYGHGLGHGVGLFVHDAGTDGPLQPGMVLTIEPGLYLPGKLGIRIEDTYRVTETGCTPLTSGLSAEPDAVEAFLAGRTPEDTPQRTGTPSAPSVGGAPGATPTQVR